MDISEIKDLSNFRAADLRDRALKSRSDRSLYFLASIDEQEAGFLCFDDWSDQQLGFIYELFVLPEYRRQGIGKALLSHGESLALQLGCKVIRLKPHALGQDLNTDHLTIWYYKLGYRATGDGELLEKHIQPNH